MAALTFLQLAARTRQECGIAGDGPSSVTSQTGIYGKIVNWVLAAHEEIQLKEPCWRFDWAQYTGVLAAKESHDPTIDFSISARIWDTRDTGAYCYPTASGANARTFLQWLSWEEFRALQPGGATGQPYFVAEAPDHTLRFYPTPTAGYTLVADYWRKPEVLAANADTPRMPAQYHLAIVWRAVMMYCGHDENTSLYQYAKQHYDRLISRMQDTELEPVEFSGPLA